MSDHIEGGSIIDMTLAKAKYEPLADAMRKYNEPHLGETVDVTLTPDSRPQLTEERKSSFVDFVAEVYGVTVDSVIVTVPEDTGPDISWEEQK